MPFRSKPVTAAASKAPFQIFLVLVAIFYSWRVYSALSITQAGSAGTFRCTSVRLRVLGLRDSAVSEYPINGTLSSFGLLRANCPVQGGSLTFDTQECAARVDFAEPTHADGYYFRNSESWPSTFDPVRWVVEATEDNGTRWLEVGASGWRMYGDGTFGLYPHLPYPTPTSRGAIVMVDHGIPWEWIVDTVVVNAIYAVGWFSTALVGAIGRERSAKTVALIMMVPAAFLYVVEAAGYHFDGQVYTALSIWIEYGPTQIIMTCGIAFFEAEIMLVLLLFSLSVLVTLIGRDTFLYGRSILIPITSFLTSSACLVLVFVVIILFLRYRVMRRAKGLVKADEMQYDSAWLQLIKDERSLGALRQICCIVEMLDKRPKFPARQLNRQLPCCWCDGQPRRRGQCACITLARKTSYITVVDSSDSFSTARSSMDSLDWKPYLFQKRGPNHNGSTLFAGLNKNSPVRSLDQLFVQASCLEPLLRNKVKV